MITINWSLWSDSHRRIRVYKTRPVAAEAQRRRKSETRMPKSEINPNAEYRSPKEIPNKPDSVPHHIWFSTFSDFRLVLSRGFAPRTSAFAKRRAERITP